jgi:NADH dehydrogenase
MLAGFFGGANAWFNSILGVAGGGSGSAAADAVSSATNAVATAAPVVTDAVSSATNALATAAPAVTDAVSSATGAVTQAVATVGHALINFNFLNLIQVILVSGKDLAHSALGDYAIKFNIPILNWLLEHTVLNSNGMQLFMQIAIVLIELLVGLALMGGLFTCPASGVSLVLQFMFITTTGLYLNTVWMIFASIACLIGAGHTIGLDYYAMPYLKRHWKKVRWAKKWYLYND